MCDYCRTTRSNIFTTQAVYALISPHIQPFAPEPGAYGIPCTELRNLPASIDITFTSQQGADFNLTVPTTEFNLGPFRSDPTGETCQTVINALDGFFVVGAPVFKYFYSVWDQGNKRMGFAPNRFPNPVGSF